MAGEAVVVGWVGSSEHHHVCNGCGPRVVSVLVIPLYWTDQTSSSPQAGAGAGAAGAPPVPSWQQHIVGTILSRGGGRKPRRLN
jgi:hypothetical protein